MTTGQFENAVREYRPYLARFVCSQLRCAEEEAREIVQTTLAELARPEKYGRVDVRGAKAMLTGAVRNRIKTSRRQRVRSRVGLEDPGELDTYQDPKDEYRRMEERALDLVRSKKAEELIKRLPPDIQDALRQRSNEVPLTDIERNQETNVKTLQIKLNRALKRMEREVHSAKRRAGKKRTVPDKKTEYGPTLVVEDNLLHPVNLTFAKHFRDGGLLQSALQPTSKTRVELEWPQDVTPRIHSALKTGDLGKLA